MIATWYPVKESLTNAAVDLETIVMLKRSMSLLLQKEAVRTDLEPLKQET